MEKCTNEKRRNGCLPKHGNRYIWKKKMERKKEEAAANASVVPEPVEEKKEDRSYEQARMEGTPPRVVQYDSGIASKNGSFRVEEATAKGKDVQNQLITVKNEDTSHKKLTIENCCMSEDVEGDKLPVDNSSSISNANGILRGKEVTSDEKPEELAEMSRDKYEDGGETKIMVGDYKSLLQESNAANKNISVGVKEVIVGEGSKEATDENRDEVLAFDESLCKVEFPKDEKSDALNLIVEQGSESLYANRTQAEPDKIPPTQHLAIPVQPPPKRDHRPTMWDGFPKDRLRPDATAYNACAPPPTSPRRNDFHKVKTFDLRGIIKSSGKGLKSIPWPRRFSVK